MTRDARESSLSRWSRRKLEAQQAEAQAPPPADLPAEDNPPVPAAEAEAPVLTDADMPDLDSLNEGSDFSPFMSPGVSDELRNLALRKLFRAQVFNIRDGLDEYDEDYTSFEKLGDIITSDMKHQIEVQQQKLREKLAEQGELAQDEDLADLEASDDDGAAAAPDAADDEADNEVASVTLAAADSDHKHGQ